MKKKRIIVCVSCIIPIIICCSCGLFGSQRYTCNVDKVESVQIITLEGYNQEKKTFEYTVLSQISDYETFVERLNKVEHSVHWGDPRVIKLQEVVIKIDYGNGDCDLLHADAQIISRSGVNSSGFFTFDDEQFNALISEYLTQ